MTQWSSTGREAFERKAWREAYGQLAAAERLGAEDIERLAVAAHLAGHDDESAVAWERAHAEHVRLGDERVAGRCAFWAGLILMLQGHTAMAGGWFARSARRGLVLRRVLDLRIPARPDLPRARGVGRRGPRRRRPHRRDRSTLPRPDLFALGLLCQGEAAVALGQLAAGMRCFDDAMVSVTTGEVSPLPAGIVYCGVIEACMDAFDLQRAAQWTDALTSWCAGQPELVPYRGQCLVHRSQVLQARGAWHDAVAAGGRQPKPRRRPPPGGRRRAVPAR